MKMDKQATQYVEAEVSRPGGFNALHFLGFVQCVWAVLAGVMALRHGYDVPGFSKVLIVEVVLVLVFQCAVVIVVVRRSASGLLTPDQKIEYLQTIIAALFFALTHLIAACLTVLSLVVGHLR